MRSFRFAALLAAALAVSAIVATPAKAVPESYELIVGELVFATQAQANSAVTQISNLTNRRRFRDAEPVVRTVPAGKYGAGPTVLATIRLVDRADADALWAFADNRFAILLPGSSLLQSSVTFDLETGTRTTTIINRWKQTG